MEENNSPRKPRSGRLLNGAILGREAEGLEEIHVEIHAEEEIIRDEIGVDVMEIHAVEEIIRDEIGVEVIDLTEDVDEYEASTDDIPTIWDELDEDRNQDGVLDLTVDLTDSLLRSNNTVSNFTSASTTEASLTSTSASAPGASMSSTSAPGASMSSTAASTPPDSLPSTATSNASAAVTCRICLDSQLDLEKEGHNLLSTVCGHIFCSKCLPNYVKERGLCPVCRKGLGPKDFHQIFL